MTRDFALAVLDISYVVTSPRFPATLPCFHQEAVVQDLGMSLTIWKRN